MKIKIKDLIKDGFYASFKALCNLPVKSPKDVLNLATASRRMRQAIEIRNDFYNERLKVWATQTQEGWKFSGENSANRFQEEMTEMDARQFDTKLPGKIALDEESFRKLTAEQVGHLLDFVSVPEYAGSAGEDLTRECLIPAQPLSRDTR